MNDHMHQERDDGAEGQAVPGPAKASESTAMRMKCEDIQAVLFDYMSRELGGARSTLVREHLRKCDACQSSAQDIQATLDLLHSASKAETEAPEHLSDARRARIVRAFTHPVIDWIDRHHTLVSLLVALAVVIGGIIVCRRTRLFRTIDWDSVFPVNIRRMETMAPGDSGQPEQE